MFNKSFGATSFGGGTSFGANTGGSFGTSGGFGTQTPAPATGLFGGTNTSQSTGIFGSTPAASFGATPQPASSGFNFGAAASTQSGGGMFGGGGTQTASIFSTPATTTAFGAKTPGGFGSTSTQPTGSLFGGGTSSFGGAQQTSGTTIKFQPQAGSETLMKNGVQQSISTRHQCITAMKEYEAKSMEELRFEDYGANRKGVQPGSTGLFGSNQPTSQASTGFNFSQQQQQQQQQQQKPGGFGFGATSTPSTNLFGQAPTQSAAGVFGSTANKPIFGTTNTTTSTATGGFTGFGTTSLFGAQANQPRPSLFGQSQPSSGTGIFGAPATTQTSSAFGSTGFGGFGAAAQPQQQQQQQPSTGLFGGKPTGTAFGQPSTSTGFSFGQQQQNQPSTGLFGAKPAATNFSGFGQTATSGFGTTTNTSLFGQNKPGGFNNPGTGLSGFGTTGNLGGGTGTGAFNFSGAADNKAGGLGGGSFGFGTAGGALNTNTTGALQFNAGGNADNQQLQQQVALMANLPYGNLPLFRSLGGETRTSRSDILRPTNPAAQKATLAASSSAQYRVSPRPTAKIKPKQINSLATGKSTLFDGLEDEDLSFGNDTLVPRRSVKKLVIGNKDGSHAGSRSPVSSINISLERERSKSPSGNNLNGSSTAYSPKNNDGLPKATAARLTKQDIGLSSPNKPPPPLHLPTNTYKTGNTSLDDTIAELHAHNGLGGLSHVHDTASDASSDHEEEEDAVPVSHPAGVVLRRPGYYTVPPLDQLAHKLDDNGDCWVNNLIVGRDGYGNVLFYGDTNVANLNLDELIHFRRKEITVYPEDDSKPDVGCELNKKSQVTLDSVWPIDKTTHELIKDPKRLEDMNYTDKIERASLKIGAKFIDYRPETGSWVFEVKHFSKYGLVDESDDEDDGASEAAKKVKTLMQHQLQQQQQQQLQPKQIPSLQQPQMPGSDKGAQLVLPPACESAVAMPRPLADPMPRPLVEADTDMEDQAIIMDERPPPAMLEVEEMTDVWGERQAIPPSSHRVASSLGVTPHSLQLQKASFFGPDEYDEIEEDVPATSMAITSPDRVPSALNHSQTSSLLRPRAPPPQTDASDHWSSRRTVTFPMASDREISGRQHTTGLSGLFDTSIHKKAAFGETDPFKPRESEIILPSGMSHKPKPLKVVGTRVPRSIPALKESLFYQRHNLVVDAGLMHGRSCRPTWAPDWTLVHAGLPLAQTTQVSPTREGFGLFADSGKKNLLSSSYQLTVEQVDCVIDFSQPDQQTSYLERMLEVQHSNANCEIDGVTPHFRACSGTDALHQYATLECSESETSRDVPASIWNLCVALWGNVPKLIECGPESYSEEYSRREALSAWVRSIVAGHVEDDVRLARKLQGDNASARLVFAYASGGQLEQACEQAQSVGDHTLALLLSQTQSSETLRHLLLTQLHSWHQNQMDCHIDEVYLKLYAMLAGQLEWQASHSTIHVCSGLDWKRCFAIYLWYKSSASATISDALRQYVVSLSEEDTEVAAPTPAYLEGNHPDNMTQDVCFQLIQLYCDKTHTLQSLLDPSTITANCLDYSISWHLLQVLSALGFCHLSDTHTESITCSYASQLETSGLWQWAVFVLLHLPDQFRREQAVRDVLVRYVVLHADPDDKAQEQFLQDKLNVPAEWIHNAKAMKARVSGEHAEEAWHLLKAGQWNDSHNIIVKHLASQAVIHESYDALKMYLSQLGSPDRCSAITNWSCGGQVFLDYIHMMDTLQQLKQSEPSGYELERLQCEVSSLCRRIGSLSSNTATDRLCQAQMSKQTANLMYTLHLMHSANGHQSAMFAGWADVCELPLPEDYALQELHQMSAAYLLHVTSSSLS